ncbi:hypothetical protein UFOVP233_64 [uncultured Caudovirales phage]|uniref:Putative DnaT-like domain-containing protein n=1 Tax=uncultured Caudovirales phage TaxID=2100421 RepID=A0A6J7WRG0_9CAUD|nr:hypothetical protein UFOVP233_64 [uncultured Caudovirales phage]
MALIVEDNTGRADAESYLSVADFKVYCDKWGYSYTGFTDTVIEQKLRLATAYIDTIFRYKGIRFVSTQMLEFPRTSLIDWSGYEVAGVPARVIKACAELAFKGFTESLYTDLDRGGRTTSESVGPISVSYAADAPAGKMYRFAEQLLGPFIRKDGDFMNPPSFGTSDNVGFERDMMSYPGGATFTDPTK